MSLYRDLVLAEGPSAFWPFDEPSPAPSDPVQDLSGHGRHGSYVGSTWENVAPPAGLGPLAGRTGTSGYALLTGAALSAGPLTLEVWLKLTGTLNAASPSAIAVGTGSNNNYGLGLGSVTGDLSGEVVSLGSGSSARVGWSGFEISPGWRHFVVVQLSTSRYDWKLYVDGADAVSELGATLISSGSGVTFSSQQFTVARYSGDQYDLEGVSSFAVYDHALSQETVRLHAAVGAGDPYATSYAPVVY